ncbi:GntR family transcriptional regulator [Lactobacillus hamsteri]|uniref:GntR family transcriptional regulator n=1 Tax=Lactobacillus hamsteri DSM 5661 = JCM 6256 TaxID=1423754 RepID=A0A0R1Y7N8_9LACO|nr:GntR family transcriptional regulator [Lactobacillus hamsteri]KRM38157.1 GntR family transcriptional regulator [Lactobacillus hamsteri DSM 5661 = JCM 6256]
MTKNLTDQAYKQILTKIIDLDYYPGQKISEKNIEKDLNIGRTPVREALLRLKEQGLINTIPKSGTYVSLIEMDRVSDALNVRRTLELSIMQEASNTTFSDDEVTRMKTLLKEENEAIAEDNVSKFFDLYDEYHKFFYINTKHMMIWNWLQNVNIYFYRIVVLCLRSDQVTWKQIVEYDKKILDAVMMQNSEKVAEYLKQELLLSPERKEGLIDTYSKYFDL